MKRSNATKTVAIIGSGPTGSTLACLLALRGIRCVLFDDHKRPSLLVGESLVPAAVPILRKIGVEQQVAAISQYKPGACFRHENKYKIDITFRKFGRFAPNYSYNVPRPGFDDILKQKALSLGVQVVPTRAKIEHQTIACETEVKLTRECLAAAQLDQHPDLIVDASGRNRLLSRTLNLPTVRGQRDDIAYFAHFKNFEADSAFEGQIVISVLECGWAWQIPLKGCLSVGVVINKARAAELGDDAEARLNNAIESSGLLSASGRRRERITPVMSYANYPIISQQAYGKGWVLAGDAMGFTDPMLSPGVFMALKAADTLDSHIHQFLYKDRTFEKYSKQMYSWYEAWTHIIDYFYDGRLLALSEQGGENSKNKPFFSLHTLLEALTKKTVSSMVSGVGTCSRFNQAFLNRASETVLKNPEFAKRFKVCN